MRILLAIDGSPCSYAAVDEVCQRSWPADSEVRIVTVLPPFDHSLLGGDPNSPTVFDTFTKQQADVAAKLLNTVAAGIKERSPGLRVTPVLLEGRPKDGILDEAERCGADLIIVGSHGYGAIGRFFLGSVSLAVALNAPCSVEIVRHSPNDSANRPQ